MNRKEAMFLLDAKLNEYRKLGYDGLAALVGDDDFPEVVGASGTQYQMEIMIRWDDKRGGDVRVVGSIDDGGWRAFLPLCSDILMTPSGEVEGGGA
jgi:hypothetical protein